MSAKFPLVTALGVKVEHAPWHEYVVKASDLEAALASAPVITSYGERNEWYANGAMGLQSDTHQARLVCVQELRKDTAEGLLESCVQLLQAAEKSWGNPLYQTDVKNYIERARRLLGAKGDE